MNLPKFLMLAVCAGLFAFKSTAFAKATGAGLYEPRTLDGVLIEAVETYKDPKTNQLGVGTGLFPFNPYYNGLGITADYALHFSRTVAWEVLNATYIYSFQKGLTAELAERFNVNPEAIEYLNYAFSTNMLFTHSSGKLIFLGDFVRYFKSAVLFGPGMLKTSQRNIFSGNLGLRFEVFTSSAFSWRLDVRDTMALPDFDHFLSFSLTTGFSF